MQKLIRFVGKEAREMVPPVIFFLIAFHILALFRALVLKGYGLHASAVAGARVILFFMYCTIRELARVLGRATVMRIFLGAPVATPTP